MMQVISMSDDVGSSRDCIVPTFVGYQFILMHLLWQGYKENSTKAKDKCGEESNLPHF